MNFQLRWPDSKTNSGVRLLVVLVLLLPAGHLHLNQEPALVRVVFVVVLPDLARFSAVYIDIFPPFHLLSSSCQIEHFPPGVPRGNNAVILQLPFAIELELRLKDHYTARLERRAPKPHLLPHPIDISPPVNSPALAS
ncbi:hypothetical protein PGT21_033493 [Puccinia graminis f. sp. tritici]|uniref:Uncharacterized protein n=1 Tax=Puccinia graminis f. sp. tritici TaxID=56615 RepID=A0A5B0QXZ8_PUCGR|nr:hypothetical protein PGT21_033493 [Puccinia graminis f. sp. tritici]